MRQKSTSEGKRKRERVGGWMGETGEEEKKSMEILTATDERQQDEARPKIRKERFSKTYRKPVDRLSENSPPVTVTLGDRSPGVSLASRFPSSETERGEEKTSRGQSRAAKLAHRAILTMTSPGTYGPNSNGRKTVYRVGKTRSW